MQLDERSFRRALGCFATGVTVITARDGDDAPIGVTVNSFSSVSLDPPLVLFCLDKQTKSLDAFRAGHFAINILSKEQRAVSVAFATPGRDKWRGVAYRRNEHGVPLIDGSLGQLECSLHEVVEGGDHFIFVGRVEKVSFDEDGEPLIYFRGGYADISRPD